MKNSLFITLLTFTYTIGFSQSINFQLDTIQQFQDADVGAMAFADVDNDGDNDVLITGKGGPILTTLYMNDGLGNFSSVTNAPFQGVYDGDVKFFDADNDTDLDVFITGEPTTSNSSDLFLNNGSGIFSLAPGNNFQTIQGGKNDVGDVDGDGDNDIIVTGQILTGKPLTKLYFNNGSGVFTQQTNSIFTNLKFGAARFIDIENDGDLDILNCGKDSIGQIITAVYTNNGNGLFNSITSSLIDSVYASDITVGDIDNDGDKDFIICGATNTSLISKLYVNNGLGVFSEQVGTPFAPVFVGTVKLADFDNDNDLDVFVIGSGLGGGINGVICKIYSNLGSNNFVQENSLIGAYLSSAAIGDVNGDQKVDIIYSGTQFSTVSHATRLYLNTSTILNLNENQTPLFSLYPNPTNGKISLTTEKKMEIEILIYNSIGSLVQKENLFDNNVQLKLQHPNGIYFIHVKSPLISKTYKVILNN